MHAATLRSVCRNKTAPTASDRALSAAKSEGLIEFHGWPCGHWQLTPKGVSALNDEVVE